MTKGWCGLAVSQLCKVRVFSVVRANLDIALFLVHSADWKGCRRPALVGTSRHVVLVRPVQCKWYGLVGM